MPDNTDIHKERARVVRNPSEAETSLDVNLSRYVHVLQRHWVIVGSFTVLGAVAGLLAALFLPATYTATSTVYVNVISTEPFSQNTQIDGRTEVQIASSYAVAAGAADTLGLSPAQIRDRVSAVLVENAQVIMVSYEASSVEAASEGAEAIANAYLNYRTEQAAGRVSTQLSEVESQLESLAAQLSDANAREANAEPGTVEESQAASDREAIGIQISSLSSVRNDLARIDTTGGYVLTPASENEVWRSPNRTLVAASGLGFGLLVGLAAAFVRHGVARKVDLREDVERETAGLVLARLGSGRAVPPAASDVEQYRILREEVLIHSDGRSMVLAVIDLTNRRGADVAANLALAVASQGVSTRLIATAIQEPARRTLRRELDLSGAQMGRVLQSGLCESLDVIMSASVRDHFGGDPVLTPAIRRLATESGQELTVLAVTADRDNASTVIGAARLADAVVFVVPTTGMDKSRLKWSADHVASAGATLLGSIMIGTDRDPDSGETARDAAPREASGADAPRLGTRVPAVAADARSHGPEHPEDDPSGGGGGLDAPEAVPGDDEPEEARSQQGHEAAPAEPEPGDAPEPPAQPEAAPGEPEPGDAPPPTQPEAEPGPSPVEAEDAPAHEENEATDREADEIGSSDGSEAGESGPLEPRAAAVAGGTAAEAGYRPETPPRGLLMSRLATGHVFGTSVDGVTPVTAHDFAFDVEHVQDPFAEIVGGPTVRRRWPIQATRPAPRRARGLRRRGSRRR